MFAVELPLGESITPTVQRIYFHKPLCIALVEDNPRVADALSKVLTEVGHQVIAAASGDELFSSLTDIVPDVVISDYRLAKQETGLDVIESLRARFGLDLPALIITGDTDPAIIRSLATKQISIMHKPLQLELLRAKLAELTA
jgi:CheY-like chemotaxis protein